MSVYEYLGTAIVTEDKMDGKDRIIVTPIEKIWDQESGLIKDGRKTYEGDIKNLDSGSGSSRHEITNEMRPLWKRSGSNNRVTAPDVCQNETVSLYKKKGTDQYYWDDEGREPGARGREDVVTAYSNAEGGGRGEDQDFDSSYYSRWNTKEGYVQIRTSQSNNEKSAYDIKIDAKNGHIYINDVQGNSLDWDSNKGSVFFKLNEEFIVDTKKIKLMGKDSIELETKNFINTSTIKAHTETPLATFSKDVTVMNDVTINRNLVVMGNITINGVFSSGGSGNGGGTMNGPMKFNGPVTINGDLTTTGKATGNYPGTKT